jgi:serine phosphatase RsbU (regulator of sigma subunit)
MFGFTSGLLKTDSLVGLDAHTIRQAWEEEYVRLGRFYALWGALFLVLFYPTSMLPDLNKTFDNQSLWLVIKLMPSVVVGAALVVYRIKTFRHEILFELIALCMFIAGNYRVTADDWLGHLISMIGLCLTSALLPILYPGYFVVNGIFAISAYFIVPYVLNGVPFGQLVTEQGFAVVIVTCIASFGVAIFRYYILKNNFMQQLIIKAALGELEVKHQELSKFNIEIIQKNDEINELLNELTAQNEEIIMQRDTLEIQKAEIERINRDVFDSITYAQRIQEAILPSDGFLKQYLTEHFVLFLPRDIVSGDFYWAQFHENQFLLAAVDCTGHGVPGAFMSMLGNAILSNIVLGRDLTTPHRILSRLDREVSRILKQSENTSRDGMDLSLVSINFEESHIQFAAANNPIYLVQANGELRVIAADKQAIGGGSTTEKVFTLTELTITEPVTVYLLSDGYQDQMGGPKGRKFMVKYLKELLVSIHTLPMEAQRQELARTIDEWMKASKAHQTDDILVIGFRLTPR